MAEKDGLRARSWLAQALGRIDEASGAIVPPIPWRQHRYETPTPDNAYEAVAISAMRRVSRQSH